MKKPASKKWLKRFILLAGILLLFVGLIIAFISPLTKYFIEKYDMQYLGREITLDYAYVNPFTGYVYLKSVKVREPKSDSVFVSANAISFNIQLRKLFSRTFEIDDVVLDHFCGTIIQTHTDLNFNDIINRFRPSPGPKKGDPFHFNMLHVKINDGTLNYRETITPINYSAIHLYIDSPGLRWNLDTLAAQVALQSGNGAGGIKGHFAMNLKTLDYKLDALIGKLELKFFEQYFRQMARYGNFNAFLDADLACKGNFTDAENLTANGLVTLTDFHFGENAQKDFASFDKFVMRVNLLNPKNKVYLLDSVTLSKPFFKFEQYDSLDNVQQMFGKQGAKVSQAVNNTEQFNLIIEIGDYIKTLAKNFFKSDFKVNRLAISEANLTYSNFRMNEKFSVAAAPLSITADSIEKSKSRVNLFLHSSIKPYGNGSVNLSINPKDSSDFDLYYNFSGLPICVFNPYLKSYTSFALDRGSLELNGQWHVQQGRIQSSNHLLVLDPRVYRPTTTLHHWVPLRMLLFFVKQEGNVLDYEIPITGDLKNPKFHLHDLIVDVAKNIFLKPATTLYRTDVKLTERTIEHGQLIKWELGQQSLHASQQRFLEDLKSCLINYPDMRIGIYPLLYTEKEKEYLLLFEAKKMFYQSTYLSKSEVLTRRDSIAVDKLSTKDAAFVAFLNKHAGSHMLFTTQQKCELLFGPDYMNQKLKQLSEHRRHALSCFFGEPSVAGRVTFFAPENIVPFNGYSYFRISYKAEIPSSLMRAYAKMNDYDTEWPRRKYLKERKAIKAPL